MNNHLIKLKNTTSPSADQQLKKKLNRAKSDLKRIKDKFKLWESYAKKYDQLYAEQLSPEIEKYFLVRKSWLLSLVAVYDKYEWSAAEDESIFLKISDTVQELDGRFQNDPEIKPIVDRFFVVDQIVPLNDLDESREASNSSEDQNSTFSSKEFRDLLEREEMDYFIDEAIHNLGLKREDFDDCKSTHEVIARIKGKMGAKRSEQERASFAATKGKNSIEVKDLYRKLASLIHPDKETDLATKAHKTELMQKLNSAYRNNDVETLMQIQAQVEMENPVDLMSSKEGLTAMIANIKKEFQRIKSETDHYVAQMEYTLGVERLSKEKNLETTIDRVIKTRYKDVLGQQKMLEAQINKDFASKKSIKTLVRRWIKEDEYGEWY